MQCADVLTKAKCTARRPADVRVYLWNKRTINIGNTTTYLTAQRQRRMMSDNDLIR